MPQSPEQFDFSTLEGQQKFEKLPKEEQEKIIEASMEEGYALNDLVITGVAGNFKRAEEILSELRQSPNFSFEELFYALRKVKGIKEKIDTLDQERERYLQSIEHLEEQIEMIGQEILKKITEELLKQRLGDDYLRIQERISQLRKEKEEIEDDTDNKVRSLEKEVDEKLRSLDPNDPQFAQKQSQIWKEREVRWREIWEERDEKLNPIRKELESLHKELRQLIKNSFEDPQERLAIAVVVEGRPVIEGTPLDVWRIPSLNVAEELGLEDFISKGTYSYYVEYEHLKAAYDHLIHKHQDLADNPEDVERFLKMKQEKQDMEEKVRRNHEEAKELAIVREGYSTLIKCGNSIKRIEELMPWVIELVGKETCFFVKVDVENRVAVMLSRERYYYGTGGVEYGVRATVIRDNPTNKDSKYYKWRDPYDPQNDDPRYSFDKAEIVSVDENIVKVKLLNTRRNFEIEEVFEVKRLGKPEVQEILSEEEQQIWKEKYYKIREELVERSYLRGALMPDYISYRFSEGPLPPGTAKGELVPYDRPQIVEEYVDEQQGLAAIIIKSQIDHDYGWGKEFKWEGYIVDKEGNTILVWSDNAYELQLRQGKRIEMKAADLIKLYKEMEKKE